MKIERSLIIRIRDNRVSDSDALLYVDDIIKQGRVSGDERSYSYLTVFADGTYVTARKRDKSDVFNVWRAV